MDNKFISIEEATRISKEKTRKELEALNNLIKQNPNLLKKKDTLLNSDDSDSSSKISVNSDYSESDSESSIETKKQKRKHKLKKNKKTVLSNGIKNTDMVSKKEIQINKLESELYYKNLDLSNSMLRITELEDSLEKNMKELEDLKLLLDFVKNSIDFMDLHLQQNIFSFKNLNNFKEIVTGNIAEFYKIKLEYEKIQKLESAIDNKNVYTKFYSINNYFMLLVVNSFIKTKKIHEQNIKILDCYEYFKLLSIVVLIYLLFTIVNFLLNL